VNLLPLDYTLAVKNGVGRVTGGGSGQNLGDVSQFGLEITACRGFPFRGIVSQFLRVSGGCL
jgi:hypothetical protein